MHALTSDDLDPVADERAVAQPHEEVGGALQCHQQQVSRLCVCSQRHVAQRLERIFIEEERKRELDIEREYSNE